MPKEGWARPSFFWYDNDKDLKVCFLMICVKWNTPYQLTMLTLNHIHGIYHRFWHSHRSMHPNHNKNISGHRQTTAAYSLSPNLFPAFCLFLFWNKIDNNLSFSYVARIIFNFMQSGSNQGFIPCLRVLLCSLTWAGIKPTTSSMEVQSLTHHAKTAVSSFGRPKALNGNSLVFTHPLTLILEPYPGIR